LDAARYAIIEDGMSNPINDRLPDLVAKDFNAVIPALLSVIEAQRTTPIVAAEVLKELGRLRNVASHASRRWVLERALRSPWPFTRDGAGLGLARLGDPNAIPALRRAAENEHNAEIRADLKLVIDELAEMITDDTPAAERH
jgi:HEAT repeat protein